MRQVGSISGQFLASPCSSVCRREVGYLLGHDRPNHRGFGQVVYLMRSGPLDALTVSSCVGLSSLDRSRLEANPPTPPSRLDQGVNVRLSYIASNARLPGREQRRALLAALASSSESLVVCVIAAVGPLRHQREGNGPLRAPDYPHGIPNYPTWPPPVDRRPEADGGDRAGIENPGPHLRRSADADFQFTVRRGASPRRQPPLLFIDYFPWND
jgi:hypothetical protein